MLTVVWQKKKKNQDVHKFLLPKGVLQSWPLGSAGGDERWKTGLTHHHHSGFMPWLPEKERIPENDGAEVIDQPTRLGYQCKVTHQKLIKASLSSESPFTLCSTTFGPSWMWNTGRGWSSTSRSSHSWGVLRLRRRWPTWKWSLLSVRRIWPNLSLRERSWKPKWFLCFRRRMTCVFRFTLWVNTLCNNAFLSRCQICMHAWTYDEPSGWRIMPDKSEYIFWHKIK